MFFEKMQINYCFFYLSTQNSIYMVIIIVIYKKLPVNHIRDDSQAVLLFDGL